MSGTSFVIASVVSYTVGSFLYSAYWTGKNQKWLNHINGPLLVSVLSGVFFPLVFLCRAWKTIAKGISEADK